MCLDFKLNFKTCEKEKKKSIDTRTFDREMLKANTPGPQETSTETGHEEQAPQHDSISLDLTAEDQDKSHASG